jgi:hypothetical protein
LHTVGDFLAAAGGLACEQPQEGKRVQQRLRGCDGPLLAGVQRQRPLGRGGELGLRLVGDGDGQRASLAGVAAYATTSGVRPD